MYFIYVAIPVQPRGVFVGGKVGPDASNIGAYIKLHGGGRMENTLKTLKDDVRNVCVCVCVCVCMCVCVFRLRKR